MYVIEEGPRTSPLREVGSILFRRKWQILITFIVVAGGIAIHTLRSPKIYEAHMKILVKNDRAGLVVSASSSDQAQMQVEVSETEINTEIELLNSNDLLRQVAVASGLDKGVTVQASPISKEARQQMVLEDAVSGLERGLKISPARKANIIQVEYMSPDPHEAAFVLQQLASCYLEAHLRLRGTPGSYAFFLSQAERYRGELKAAEARLREFNLKNDILVFGPQQEELLRRSSESNSMLLAADAAIREDMLKIANARAQLATVEPRVTTQTRTLYNQNSVERLAGLLVELENRRTQLLSKFQPDDRLVQEVSEEIANTEAGLRKAKELTGSDQTTDVNPVRQALTLDLSKEQLDLAGLEARRQTLRQQTEDYRAHLMKLGKSTEEYDDLVRRHKETEENYLLYTRKSEEGRIADSLDKQKIANVVIAENPVEPHQPFKPNVPMNIELGTAFAAALSLGIAFLLEYLSHPFPQADAKMHDSIDSEMGSRSFLETVEQPGDLEALTGLPILAITKRT